MSIIRFIFALIVVLLFSCSQKETSGVKPDLSHLSWANRLPAIEVVADQLGKMQAEGEWESLFNGRDLSGWTVKHNPKDTVTTFWTVKDGAIVANSLGRGDADYVWLVSEKEYTDFILRLKFRAYQEQPGNSGVQIRSRYDDAESWLDGPQIDLAPGTPWRTGMIYDETRETRRWIAPDVPKGSWVDTTMANPAHPFQFDQWNELEITAVGTKVLVVLNGVIVNGGDLMGILDDEAHQSHNVGMSGYVALQIHRKNEVLVRFKDVFVKKITG